MLLKICLYGIWMQVYIYKKIFAKSPSKKKSRKFNFIRIFWFLKLKSDKILISATLYYIKKCIYYTFTFFFFPIFSFFLFFSYVLNYKTKFKSYSHPSSIILTLAERRGGRSGCGTSEENKIQTKRQAQSSLCALHRRILII